MAADVKLLPLPEWVPDPIIGHLLNDVDREFCEQYAISYARASVEAATEALRKRCEAVEADELVESLRSAASRWKRESDYHASGIADDYGAGQRHAFLSCATEMLAIIDQAIAAAQEPSHG